jgi:DNA-binding CsgD family transcriptional regulator
VAPSTARSHLNSVFAKAKVSSQAELAQRVMACASPLRG